MTMMKISFLGQNVKNSNRHSKDNNPILTIKCKYIFQCLGLFLLAISREFLFVPLQKITMSREREKIINDFEIESGFFYFEIF